MTWNQIAFKSHQAIMRESFEDLNKILDNLRWLITKDLPEKDIKYVKKWYMMLKPKFGKKYKDGDMMPLIEKFGIYRPLNYVDFNDIAGRLNHIKEKVL